MVKSVFDAQSFSRDDFFIEAWINKDGGFKKARVDVGRIAYRTDNGNGTSSIVLADGKEIKVALSLDELDAKIVGHSFKDGDLIDLKPFSGAALEIIEAETSKAQERLDAEKIMAEFNIRAQNEKTLQVAIHGFDQADKDIVYRVLIPVDNISRYEEDCTFNHKKEWAFIAGRNFDHFFFCMPIEKFQQRIETARASGQKFLNLLEETKPPAQEGKTIARKPRVIS